MSNAIVKETVLALLKKGDVVKVKPISKLPNFGGTFKVDYVTDHSFVYGCSECNDGYEMPFWAIEKVKIIG